MASKNASRSISIGDVEIPAEELTYGAIRDGVNELRGIIKYIEVATTAIMGEPLVPDALTLEIKGIGNTLSKANSDIDTVTQYKSYNALGAVDIDDVDSGMEYIKTVQAISEISSSLEAVSAHLFTGLMVRYGTEEFMINASKKISEELEKLK